MKRVFGMIRNVRNFPAYLLQKWGFINREPFILKSLNGVTVEVPKRMFHPVKEIFFADDYRYDKIQSDVLKLTNTPLIVDVGANVGYLSAFTFTRFPMAHVISVEPLPKNLALLKRNKQRNSGRNWQVFEGVLSDTDGEMEIRFDDTDSFSTSASMYGLGKGKDLHLVRSQTLSSLMLESSVSVVHILKLDCEGAEYDILYCLNNHELNRIAYISLETHQVDEDRKNRDALVKWLNEKGWKTEVIRSKVLASNPNFKK